MNLKVFPQNFNFASQIIIGTLHKLEFALILVLLQTLSQESTATLVFALNNFEKTSFIVRYQIFKHEQRHAFLVGTNYTSIAALRLVRLELLSLKSKRTSIFKQTLSFVWTIHNFEFTNCLAVVVLKPSLYKLSTFVSTGYL